MIVYVYRKCSTCRDALRYLAEHNVTFQQKELTVMPPSIEELQSMLKYQSGKLKKMFNVSGQLYKEMELSKKLDDLTVAQALLLLNQHGMLVKRPFLLGDGCGLTGFNEFEWCKII